MTSDLELEPLIQLFQLLHRFEGLSLLRTSGCFGRFLRHADLHTRVRRRCQIGGDYRSVPGIVKGGSPLIAEAIGSSPSQL